MLNSQDLALRAARPEDSKNLLAWRNDPLMRANAKNRELVNENEHQAWFNKVLSDGKSRLFIAEYQNESVGMLRFDPLSKIAGAWELSWNLSPARRGKGLGALMLKKGVLSVTGEKRATIRKENIASIKMALSAGFRELPSDGEFLNFSSLRERAVPQVLLLTQARVGSSRLPAKVLLPVEGTQTLLDLHLRRAHQAKNIQQFVVASTFEAGAERIAEIARRQGFEFFAGSTNDVLDRFCSAAIPLAPDYVVRITADCPLVDPELIDEMVALAVGGQWDYLSNSVERSYPDGFDVEIMRFEALTQAWLEAKDPFDREHVTPFIWKRAERYRIFHFKSDQDYSKLRVTVDFKEDLAVVKVLLKACGPSASWRDYTKVLQGMS